MPDIQYISVMYIFKELKRIGVNLNQGTHRLNQGDVPKDYGVLQNDLIRLLSKILDLFINDRQSNQG